MVSQRIPVMTSISGLACLSVVASLWPAILAFILPQRIDQAGKQQATIYDQNGNVVYYDVRFSRNLCAVEQISKLQNFPGGTTELKTAWKVLE